MKNFVILLFLCLWSGLNAQNFTLYGKKMRGSAEKFLENELNKWESYDVRYGELYAALKSKKQDKITLSLALGDLKLEAQLVRCKMFSEDFVLRSQDEIVLTGAPDIFTYQGIIGKNAADKFFFAISEKSFFASFKQGSETFYLQQLSDFSKEAPETRVILYEKKQVKPISSSCISEGIEHGIETLNHSNHEALDLFCQRYNIKLAIALDCEMLRNNEGIKGAINQCVNIMGSASALYDDEFDFPISFEIATIFVAVCTLPSPWANSNDPSTLLSSFANWANPSGNNGFGVPHHLGQLWTGRSLNGNTVGIAYTCSFCSNGPGYHLLSDFTNNSSLLTCMTAHEIGHNLCASHTPPLNGNPTIMSAIANTNLIWHPTSKSEIQGALTFLGDCMLYCNTPPVIKGIKLQYASSGLCLADILAYGTDLQCADRFEWNLEYRIIQSPCWPEGETWTETYTTSSPWLDNVLYDLGCGEAVYTVKVTITAVSHCGNATYAEAIDVKFTECIPPSPPDGVSEKRNIPSKPTGTYRNLTFEIQPNPSNGEFRIDWNTQGGAGKIDLFESTGNLIKTIEFQHGNSLTVNYPGLPAGYYIVRLTQDGQSLSKGIIIQ